MKLPKTFVPEKSLEEKTKQLLKEKKTPFDSDDYDITYKKLSGSLYDYINARGSGWKGIFYISDNFEKNRHELIKNMLEDIISGLSMSCNWRLLNYYGELGNEDLFNELYQAVLYEKLDESSICIVYTSSRMTDRLAEDVTKWQMLMRGASICSLSELDE
ncbi:MAG: hypothetical protein Q8O03_01030 [Nanoarchaeota archaeon]|nr:hypothetical protein [Nanoarchaeota archaeon]